MCSTNKCSQSLDVEHWMSPAEATGPLLFSKAAFFLGTYLMPPLAALIIQGPSERGKKNNTASKWAVLNCSLDCGNWLQPAACNFCDAPLRRPTGWTDRWRWPASTLRTDKNPRPKNFESIPLCENTTTSLKPKPYFECSLLKFHPWLETLTLVWNGKPGLKSKFKTLTPSLEPQVWNPNSERSPRLEKLTWYPNAVWNRAKFWLATKTQD